MFNKHFRKYIFKYSIPLLIGIAVLVFIDYVQTNVPIIIGDIINILDKFDKSEVTEIFAKDELLNLTVSLITVVAITGIGRVFWRLAIFGTSRKIEYGLRNEMFIHATTLSQDYYNEQKVGGLMTYFINDLAAVRMAYGPGIMMLIDSTFLGGFVFYKMFKLNKELTLILIVPIVLLLVAMVIINKSMRKQFKIRQEKFRDLSDYTQENLSGISIVKAYVREAFEIMTFKRKSKELYDTNMKFYKKSVLVEVVTSIIINLIVITIIGFGAYAVVKTANLPDAEKFDVGNFTAYIALFFMLSWPTRALTRVLSIYSQAGASAQRITDFLETKPSVYDKDNLIEPDLFIPEIEVKNLTFRYPDSNFNAIDNMSFKINQGEMVGILGKTGSGKTTLVDLMLRVYNVKHDKILISKTDIMKLPLKVVRDKIGYVPQDNFLFSDTIKNNIAFSNSSLTMEEVIDASKLADIYDNVTEFQLGFETILGERGVTVSGGQKQRISIARAIAKNPEILILDDAVSAVDTKTEETIIKNLYDLRKGKTTIFIAHRISTVQNLDKIIVIDEGKVVAIGSHDELLETSEFYRDIVKRQTLEKLAEEVK
ncbi:ABC transporter ATP-binding protein [Haploplasma modicum]|uniref:ABC transporter ATP-binding protein n=1 Tax=Haploplasma modicum TaxID=2150 RepID=UPI00047DED3A|nr:ABC transporter ATP-binding protein [Haploplasma modicum]